MRVVLLFIHCYYKMLFVFQIKQQAANGKDLYNASTWTSIGHSENAMQAWRLGYITD